MGELKQVSIESTFHQAVISPNRLAVYDQYGSLAYGIILQVIPEPELAQTVLIDLFTSLQLRSDGDVPTVGEIVRLARAKALSVRSMNSGSASAATPLPVVTDTTDLAKLVFTLSFCQGLGLETIARKLNLSSANVLKAFCTYFRHLRSS